MIRRLYALILLPAVSLGLFVVELLRQHGYEGLTKPSLFTAAFFLAIATPPALWIAYSVFLSRFADIDLQRALILDLLSYLPFAFLLAWFIPEVGGLLNIGTILFFLTSALCVSLKAAVLLYCHRATVQAVLSRPYPIIGLVVGLAVLLRVSLVAANRFHGDEALYSYWGLLIASGKDIFLMQEAAVDKPPVFPYTLAFFFRAFGPTETVARLPNVIASLGSIVIIYQIALELFDRRVATMTALFLTLSPFDIQYAPTAFTDPLMVALALAACLLALRGRHFGAGVAIGLAVMTKPLALFFFPLLLLFATLSPTLEGWRGLLGKPGLRLGLGLIVVVLAVLFWDVVIRVNCRSFLSASAARYGGLRLVPSERILPRIQGWMRQLQYLTGSQGLNITLIVGVPSLLCYGLLRSREREGWLFDWALAGFVVYFVGLHTVLSFSIWDRYLLGLVPVTSILLSRVLFLPYDVFFKGQGFGRAKALYFSLIGVFLFATLLQPTQAALRYDFPVGGDHGAFQGIDDVASYFRGNAPDGSIIFHKWLGWHYSFYMFDIPLALYYYPSHEFILDTAQQLPMFEKYVVFPSWESSEELETFLRAREWELRELHRTYRPDGTVSFTIYRIQPMEE